MVKGGTMQTRGRDAKQRRVTDDGLLLCCQLEHSQRDQTNTVACICWILLRPGAMVGL